MRAATARSRSASSALPGSSGSLPVRAAQGSRAGEDQRPPRPSQDHCDLPSQRRPVLKTFGVQLPDRPGPCAQSASPGPPGAGGPAASGGMGGVTRVRRRPARRWWSVQSSPQGVAAALIRRNHVVAAIPAYGTGIYSPVCLPRTIESAVGCYRLTTMFLTLNPLTDGLQ